MRRFSGHAGVTLEHAVLHFDRAKHRVDHAAKFNQNAVADSLDDAAVTHGDLRIDEIAAQRPQPRQDAIFVRANEPAIADHVRAKDSRQFSGLVQRASPQHKVATRVAAFS